MTMISPLGGELAAQEVLAEAEEHYRRTIRALTEIIADVETGRSARARDLKGALSDLNKAAQTAFDERARVEKRIRADAGIINDYALDLDAARDEIRRRLACLRGAGGAGRVPGGAE
ncbi:hypothetical protein [Actibacterium ureilyticum]|uniref:hypothetical protein n=1 Tax=Actibacterium ureilyticum TaxID=1590614 RepID=UPI001140F336|nr:hypothetical protein [Actibacterium ureilyticum]